MTQLTAPPGNSRWQYMNLGESCVNCLCIRLVSSLWNRGWIINKHKQDLKRIQKVTKKVKILHFFHISLCCCLLIESFKIIFSPIYLKFRCLLITFRMSPHLDWSPAVVQTKSQSWRYLTKRTQRHKVEGTADLREMIVLQHRSYKGYHTFLLH